MTVKRFLLVQVVGLYFICCSACLKILKKSILLKTKKLLVGIAVASMQIYI